MTAILWIYCAATVCFVSVWFLATGLVCSRDYKSKNPQDAAWGWWAVHVYFVVSIFALGWFLRALV